VHTSTVRITLSPDSSTASALRPRKDIPTLKEQGVDLVYPDCDFSFYFPADTSDDVIAYSEDLVQKVLADPSAAEGVANVDMMPYYLNAEDSAKNDQQIYNTIKEIADSIDQ